MKTKFYFLFISYIKYFHVSCLAVLNPGAEKAEGRRESLFSCLTHHVTYHVRAGPVLITLRAY